MSKYPGQNPQRHDQRQNQYTSPTTANPRHESLMLNNLKTTEFRCRDPFWAVLFYISFIINLALAIQFIVKQKKNGTQFNMNSFKITTDDEKLNTALTIDYKVIIFGISTAIAFTILWMILIISIGKYIIKFCLLVFPILTIAGGIIAFVTTQNIIGFVIGIVFGLLGLIYAWFVWKRIPFAEAMLSIAISVFNQFKSPLFINLLIVILSGILIIVIGLAQMGLKDIVGDDNIKTLFWILLLFQLWHLYTYSNVSHTTSCGVMAQWFYTRETELRNVTCESFTRAMTTSFGSIAFGSFLEAIFATLQMLLNNAKQTASENGNTGAMIIACIAECLVRCIGDILEYINQYAYVQVSVYGKSYIQSAKDTWDLFKTKGITMIINDDLSGLPFVIGNIILILIVLGVCLIMNRTSIISIIIVQLFAIVFYGGIVTIIKSYIKTLFVCWAEDPQTFKLNRPDRFDKLANAARGAGYALWF